MKKFYTMEHSGGLKEALMTKQQLSEEVFKKLIESGIYQYYGYDERIKCTRYIICNIENNLGLPVWILKEE